MNDGYFGSTTTTTFLTRPCDASDALESTWLSTLRGKGVVCRSGQRRHRNGSTNQKVILLGEPEAADIVDHVLDAVCDGKAAPGLAAVGQAELDGDGVFLVSWRLRRDALAQLGRDGLIADHISRQRNTPRV